MWINLKSLDQYGYGDRKICAVCAQLKSYKLTLHLHTLFWACPPQCEAVGWPGGPRQMARGCPSPCACSTGPWTHSAAPTLSPAHVWGGKGRNKVTIASIINYMFFKCTEDKVKVRIQKDVTSHRVTPGDGLAIGDLHEGNEGLPEPFADTPQLTQLLQEGEERLCHGVFPTVTWGLAHLHHEANLLLVTVTLWVSTVRENRTTFGACS